MSPDAEKCALSIYFSPPLKLALKTATDGGGFVDFYLFRKNEENSTEIHATWGDDVTVFMCSCSRRCIKNLSDVPY